LKVYTFYSKLASFARKTSMPPPEPRSRTTASFLSSAKAIGFPHPTDTLTTEPDRLSKSSVAYPIVKA